MLWLRQDLRLHDNGALLAAARFAKREGGRLTLLFVHSPGEDGDDVATGAARRNRHRLTNHHESARKRCLDMTLE